MRPGARRFLGYCARWALCSIAAAGGIEPGRVAADTVNSALVEAYQNNPQLNAQRSATRAVDENVPIAVAGYRPRVTGTSSITEVYLDTLTKIPGTGRYVRATGENAVTTAAINGT